MLVGQEYDEDQFQRDVRLILNERGYWKPWGFFMIRAHDDDVISLTDHVGMITMVDVRDRANPSTTDQVQFAIAADATPLIKDHVLRLAVRISDEMHEPA